MGAYESASAVWGHSSAATACCSSADHWLSDPCLEEEGEPALQQQVLCTLEEVAAELGIHREQVRIIERRALRKCLAYCKARGLRLEDLLAT